MPRQKYQTSLSLSFFLDDGVKLVVCTSHVDSCGALDKLLSNQWMANLAPRRCLSSCKVKFQKVKWRRLPIQRTEAAKAHQHEPKKKSLSLGRTIGSVFVGKINRLLA